MVVAFDIIAAKWNDASIDPKTRIQWLLELRDAVDNLPDLTNFIHTMVPLFLHYLSKLSSPKLYDCQEHRARLLVLEIINRIPNNHEALKSHASDANSVLISVLENDNEESGLVALRIFIDLHRNYRNVLEEREVQQFLDFVLKIYDKLKDTVHEMFDSKNGLGLISPTQASPMPASADTPSSASGASDFSAISGNGKPLTRSLCSFKVLTECPIIIVILFQLYRKYVANNIPRFVEAIITALDIQVASQIEAQKAAEAAGTIFIGVNPQIKNRPLYADFIASQVKTLSFLAYIIRSYASALRQHQAVIPSFIIHLLQNCPPEACGTRKELLVATRHILSTDFRQAFVAHLHTLLDTNVLIGNGLTAQETLKPLSYSLLADFIHHVRSDLSVSLVSLTIVTYSKNLHDSSIPLSIQTMSAKLLVNLVDSIIPDKFPSEFKRPFLIRILSTFIQKFSSIKENLPYYFKNYGPDRSSERIGQNSAMVEGEFCELGRPIRTFTSETSGADIFRDLRFLLKTLISGLKNILFGLRGCNPIVPVPANASQFVALTVRGFSLEESELFVQLFKDGVSCFDMYHYEQANESEKGEKNSALTGLPQGLPHASMSPEEKEMLDQFAHIFTVIDPAIFQDVFSSLMEFFLAKVHTNLALLTIPQYILAVTGVSQNFASILLRYLMDRLEVIGSSDLKGQVHLRLFKLVFLSVTVYPDENESVLQPHLGDLITWSLKNSAKASEPLNYFILLRSLFRSIGGGRYESLYKEVLPLLPVILEQLNILLASAPNTSTKELFVELVLTVPVRLSVLLPHLQHLMQPLVLALQAGPDLVSQGLRTLELCIDNLRQDFLDPILSPVINLLMKALWKHLKPLPYNSNHSLTTLRILGKLGGRNRRLLKDFPHVNYREQVESGFDVKLKFGGNVKPVTVSLDEAIKLAVSTLENVDSIERSKKEAYSLIQTCVSLLISESKAQVTKESMNWKNYYDRLQLMVDTEALNKPVFEDHTDTISQLFSTEKKPPLPLSSRFDIPVYSAKQGHSFGIEVKEMSTSVKRLAQDKIIEVLLNGLFVAASLPSLSNEALPFLRNVYIHYTILKVHELMENREMKVGIKKPFMNLERPNDFIDPTGFPESVVASLAHKRVEVADVAESIVVLIYKTADMLLMSKDIISSMPLFFLFASRFCSHCYKPEWYYKRGGCRGIRILSSRLDFGIRWVWMQEMKFVRALLYILKDNAPDFAMNTIEESRRTLSLVLKICNRRLEESDGNVLLQERIAYFNPVICLLITELSNARSLVRETIQSSLELLAEINGGVVTELLMPHKDRLLNPIYMKPLRALPFPIQIGHIDAVTYCLSLRPPFITFSEEFLRLLHEALALADAEDHALVSKNGQFRNASSLISLRVVCLKLLSTAMGCDEFHDEGKHANTRNRIISIFFKSLYARSNEIVDVAKKGLQKVITHQHKLPKELLQNGLRPILMNLSDHKKLTLPGLEGLARLLELLTSYFKVEIGKKLYEHLSRWADPAVLEDAANKTLSENGDVKVMVAIMNVFHLLPPTANIFMDSLILMTAKLDASLRRCSSSPFHVPLIKYLHIYASDCIEYFFSHINITPIAHLFVQLFGNESSDSLRQELMKKTDKFLDIIFQDPAVKMEAEDAEDANAIDHVALGIQVIKTVVVSNPEWLENEPSVINKLLEYMKENTGNPLFWSIGSPEKTWNLFKSKESSNLLDILLLYVNRNKSEHVFLFDVLSIMHDKNSWLISSTFKNFFQDFCASIDDEMKKSILVYFFGHFKDESFKLIVKIYSLRWLIIPIINDFVKRDDSDFLDAKLIQMIDSSIWSNPSVENDDLARIEYLQLTSVLLGGVAGKLTSHKKDIIRYGWSLLSADDPVTKQAAYVMVSKFIEVFETPQKMILQVLISLIRANGGEIRNLVKQALDICIPSCAKRIGTVGKGSDKVPPWVRIMKKIVTEESHSTTHLILIWQIIASHFDYFYENREQFVSSIVTSLVRVGLTLTPTIENKMLTVDMVELILVWEQRRMVEAGEPLADESIIKESKFYVPTTPIRPAQSDDSRLAQHLVDSMVIFLIRLASPINDLSSKRDELLNRILKLLKGYLTVWPQTNIKYSIFEKLFPANLTEITMEHASAAVDVLSVIGVILESQPLEKQADVIVQVSKCLEKSVLTMSPKVHAISSSIFKTISSIVKSGIDFGSKAEFMDFIARMNAMIVEMINNNRFLPSALSYLEAWFESESSDLASFLPHLSKMLSNVSREYINQIQLMSSGGQGSHALLELNSAMIVSLIKMNRDLVSNDVEAKKSFLSDLVLLAEKNVHKDILVLILSCCKDWLIGKSITSMIGNLKDIITLLNRLACLEQTVHSALYEDYLELIIYIYEEKSFSRTELTVKLESSFMLGLKHSNPELRSKFFNLFDQSVERGVFQRLHYIFASQNWESCEVYFWIHIALDLLLVTIPTKSVVDVCPSMHKLLAMSKMFLPNTYYEGSMEIDSREKMSLDISEEGSAFFKNHLDFLESHTEGIKAEAIVGPLKHLLFESDGASFSFWTQMFPYFWNVLNGAERDEVKKSFVPLLAKEYHGKQAGLDLNVIQAILEGFNRCHQLIDLPPQLVKYLGKNFNAWHVAIDLLQKASEDRARLCSASKEDARLYEMTMDALSELFSALNEEDMYYGLWRRRCIYGETNAALSFEQQGMWEEAQKMYELAENKARAGLFPFSESEYCLWEDHWIKATKRLQQWDVLNELAKYENNSDLGLDCAWRLADWSVDKEPIKLLLQGASRLAPTQKKVYESFLCLSQANEHPEKMAEFNRVLEESVQTALISWHSLPGIISHSHINLLILFQQLVELQEASQIYNNLSSTNVSNRSQLQNELKGILVTTWRERLPNMWDDINVWSNLVAWRQHVFSAINKAFQPFANEAANASAGGSSGATFAYRGYHETAWIINRFAHVARKHDLNDVCINSLSKIYTLPNIEIQDAFLKLREQAKCYFSNPQELTVGLEIINQTNLGYFVPQQKAEFYALKAIFLWKMNLLDEANKIFGQAVQVDMNLAKGWASWGHFNDQRFQQTGDISYGSNAVNCYLQAATIYQNSRARKYLARVLWLLSFEDSQGSLSNAFDLFNNELPAWYWVTFIPQLLTSLTRKEAKQAKNLLHKIAKSFPQALYFPLRTSHEDYRQHITAGGGVVRTGPPNVNTGKNRQNVSSPDALASSSTPVLPTSLSQEVSGLNAASVSAADNDPTNLSPVQTPLSSSQGPPSALPLTPLSAQRKLPWEYTEELMTFLKTGSPLLALSMESMVDHISQRLRSTPDEDLYRIIVTLRYESLQQSMIRLNANVSEGLPTSSLMELSLLKVSEMLSAPTHFNHRYKEAFDRDFITFKPSLQEIVAKLQKWRDKLEPLVNKVPKSLHLENFSRYLVEFEHQKYEEVEVPGQYLLPKDNNDDFVKIARFDPQIEIVRKHGTCYRRITIHGHDGSKYPFIVQNPAARHARREERIMQLFRILNTVLDRRKESRKRSLGFHMPLVVPLSTHVRIIQDDVSYVSLEDVYERHCESIGIHPDDVVLYFRDEMTNGLEKYNIQWKRGNPELLNLRQNLFERIGSSWVPETILSSYMKASAPSYVDLWTLRKQFTLSYATMTFMTYVMGIGHRFPHKTLISRQTGSVLCMDLLPSLNQSGQFTLTEAVPFRLTPNIQNFITPVGMEGVFTSSIMAVARCLTEPEFELEDFLSIFIRDELITWFHASQSHNQLMQTAGGGGSTATPTTPINTGAIPNLSEGELRTRIAQNVEFVLKRAQALACLKERDITLSVFKPTGAAAPVKEGQQAAAAAAFDTESLKRMTTSTGIVQPVNQTILDLISAAVNPQKLCQMDAHWHPWL